MHVVGQGRAPGELGLGVLEVAVGGVAPVEQPGPGGAVGAGVDEPLGEVGGEGDEGGVEALRLGVVLVGGLLGLVLGRSGSAYAAG